MLDSTRSGSVGGVLGASFVRFGARGPLLLLLGTAATAVLLVLLLAPHGTAFSFAFRPDRLAAEGAAVIGLSTVGQYLFLRRAGVR